MTINFKPGNPIRILPPINAFRLGGCWVAEYLNKFGEWVVARDAAGYPILCETESLAKSVAEYRHRRLNPLEQ